MQPISVWILAACALYLLLVAALGFILFRLRRVRERSCELEAMVSERTAQLEAANEELGRIGKLDRLTGIANFSYFSEVFQREWSRSVRQRGVISLLLVDIDFFKPYNDTYGRLAGDDCLKKLAEGLKRAVIRITDMTARYGGEEFVVLLPETDADGAQVVAERILREVAALQIPHAKSPVASVVTVSIGISTLVPQLNMEPDVLFRRADRALHQAKEGGRNRITIANG